jgi:hypothetical protein
MRNAPMPDTPKPPERTPVRTALSGYHLLYDPLLNKGTAFSEAERDAFDLHGLLPPVSSLREVAITVAIAVAAQACRDGLTAGIGEDEVAELVRETIWLPGYAPYQRIGSPAR